MSSIELTFTPPTFEDWLEQEGARPADREHWKCHRCFGRADWLLPDQLCDTCLRRYHARYVHQEQTIRELLAQLDPQAWRTIIELDDMTVDTRGRDLVRWYCAELLAEQQA